MVSDDAPIRVCSPAASRSSAFHRKVVRNRSSAPTRCSTSVPANGGSHGVSLSLMGATLETLPPAGPSGRTCLAERRWSRNRRLMVDLDSDVRSRALRCRCQIRARPSGVPGQLLALEDMRCRWGASWVSPSTTARSLGRGRYAVAQDGEDEARRLGQHWVGPEHTPLGVLRGDPSAWLGGHWSAPALTQQWSRVGSNEWRRRSTTSEGPAPVVRRSPGATNMTSSPSPHDELGSDRRWSRRSSRRSARKAPHHFVDAMELPETAARPGITYDTSEVTRVPERPKSPTLKARRISKRSMGQPPSRSGAAPPGSA